jgi:uncharacterized membrane protein
MKLKSKLHVLALSAALSLSPLLLWPLGAVAQSGDSSRASGHLSMASGVVALGSISVLAGSGELIVTGVEQSARGVSVVVREASNASGQSVTLLLDGAAASAVAVGHAVQASATGMGYVLIASGKAIAFIPNEIGQSLIHQSRYSR